MLMNVYEDINDELRNQTIQVGNYFKKILWRLAFSDLDQTKAVRRKS